MCPVNLNQLQNEIWEITLILFMEMILTPVINVYINQIGRVTWKSTLNLWRCYLLKIIVLKHHINRFIYVSLDLKYQKLKIVTFCTLVILYCSDSSCPSNCWDSDLSYSFCPKLWSLLPLMLSLRLRCFSKRWRIEMMSRPRLPGSSSGFWAKAEQDDGSGNHLWSSDKGFSLAHHLATHNQKHKKNKCLSNVSHVKRSFLMVAHINIVILEKNF